MTIDKKTVICPHCGGEIIAGAVKCKHCKSFIGPKKDSDSEKHLELKDAKEQKVRTISWQEGTYTGELVDGKPWGKGSWFNGAGDKYEGDWEAGEYSGNGKLEEAVGDIYTGDFKQGKRNGIGQLNGHDSSFYEGPWVDGLAQGNGRYISSEGAVYEGEVKKGVIEGKGKLTYPDGAAVYEGDFADGNYNGYGTITFENGSNYSGEWKNGQMHGKGIFTDEDGSSHKGVFEDGELVKNELDLLIDKYKELNDGLEEINDNNNVLTGSNQTYYNEGQTVITAGLSIKLPDDYIYTTDPSETDGRIIVAIIPNDESINSIDGDFRIYSRESILISEMARTNAELDLENNADNIIQAFSMTMPGEVELVNKDESMIRVFFEIMPQGEDEECFIYNGTVISKNGVIYSVQVQFNYNDNIDVLKQKTKDILCGIH